MIKKGVTLLLSVFVLTVAWGENHYAPGKKNSLRAPSVPLVTSDPYFCIWSPYDKLYEGNTEHLTSSLRTPKFFVKEFSYFLMPCHQHGLRINLLVQR